MRCGGHGASAPLPALGYLGPYSQQRDRRNNPRVPGRLYLDRTLLVGGVFRRRSKDGARAAPAGEARNLALGRLRGPARPALRPVCREPAGLGPGASPRPRKRGPELSHRGRKADGESRGGAPRGEHPDRKGCPAPRTRGLLRCASRRSAPLGVFEGIVPKPRTRKRRENAGGCLTIEAISGSSADRARPSGPRPPAPGNRRASG
jgi:hypothetical protein